MVDGNAALPSAQPRTYLTGRRALIVEEAPDLAAELQHLLAGEGIETRLVSCDRDVGTALGQFDPQTCLVDLDLRSRRGPELLDLFATLFPHARSIVLAEDLNQPAVLDALRRHAVEPVAKPVQPVQLIGAVARSLRAYDESRQRATAATEIRDLQHRLAQAGRATQALLSNVSHEFRTPLNAIIGFSEILEHAESADPETLRQYASAIHRSGRQLLTTVNDILTYAALDAGMQLPNPEPFEPGELVDSCLQQMAAVAAAAQVALTRRAGASLPRLLADRQLVQKALLNLLDNAVKFAAKRGKRVGVVTRSSDLGGLLIQVADNGAGLDAGHLAALTRPFAVGDGVYARDHAGIGLGLALAQKIMQLHGGRVELRSRPNVGTVVALAFPEHCLQR